MDMNEVYMLLMIVEKAHVQGTLCLNIRNEAIAKLSEINATLDPNKKDEEPEAEIEDQGEPVNNEKEEEDVA